MNIKLIKPLVSLFGGTQAINKRFEWWHNKTNFSFIHSSCPHFRVLPTTVKGLSEGRKEPVGHPQGPVPTTGQSIIVFWSLMCGAYVSIPGNAQAEGKEIVEAFEEL